MAESIAGNVDAALEADFAFHSRLYTIVDNPIFTMLNMGFSHVLHENVRLRRDFAARRDAKNPDGSINTDTVHSEIVDAPRHTFAGSGAGGNAQALHRVLGPDRRRLHPGPLRLRPPQPTIERRTMTALTFVGIGAIGLPMALQSPGQDTR